MTTVSQVVTALRGFDTKTGGVISTHETYKEENGSSTICFDLQGRRRLDHFGNDGDGWDEEGWEEEYVSPLLSEVRKRLISRHVDPSTLTIEVGEKGHLEINVHVGV